MEADIQAVFQEQEGVEIRENGTQAVIESILPGEEVILTAVAELPDDFTEEKLLNTVLVRPEGDEKKGKSDEAEVMVEQKLPKTPVSSNRKLNAPQKTPTVSPASRPSSGQGRTTYTVTTAPGTVYSGTGTQTDGKGTAYTTAPKTSDESPLLLLTVLAGAAGAVIVMIGGYRLRKNKINKNNR